MKTIRRRRPLWLRLLTSAALLTALAIGFFCAAQAFRIYAHNRAADDYAFRSENAPQPPVSILVVSPHPDDETLGAGGLLTEARRNGCPTHVVFLTCGDAFRVGVSRYYKTLRVQPADCIRYGTMRENEARAALEHLGLDASDITFLGFPDRGLMPMWEDNWTAAAPYTSAYTRVHAVPYPDAQTPGAPYCGQSVVTDLTAAIRRVRPTDIYVTHPSDDHPDHAAAPAFVNLAVDELRKTGDPWAQGIRIHYFLVHRGDWPVPQGLAPDDALAPPAPLMRLDTRWQTLPLPKAAVALKEEALGRYASQQMMMHRFLTSFVRRNEVFGDLDYLPAVPTVADGALRLTGNDGGWTSLPCCDRDPQRHGVARLSVWRRHYRSLAVPGSGKPLRASRRARRFISRSGVPPHSPVIRRAGFDPDADYAPDFLAARHCRRSARAVRERRARRLASQHPEGHPPPCSARQEPQNDFCEGRNAHLADHGGFDGLPGGTTPNRTPARLGR